MRLWPLMTTITEREGVSVTQMQSRLAERFDLHASRWAIRRALRRLERYGILQSHPRGSVQGGRRLFFRPKRSGEGYGIPLINPAKINEP